MKKLYCTITALLFFYTNLFAGEVCLEARAAYYYPTDSTFRDIYDGAGLYGLELSYQCGWNLYPWASAGYFYQTGQSIPDKTDTTVYLVPLACGLKYQWCCKCIRPYLGVGVNIPYLYTKDESPFVVNIRNKWGVGAIFKSGFIYDFGNCFYSNIFLDYSWTKIDFNDTDITLGTTADISGLAFGAGIGFRF